MNEEILFHQALDRPPGERVAFLDEACGGDVTLRQRVHVLLLAHDNPGSFLSRPALDHGATEATWNAATHPSCTDAAIGSGARVGPYRLLRLIGEGGMGAVWMAEQTEPVRRLVAVKVIKPGMDSARIIARFETERQALALMDHPNIARVLDAGTTTAESGCVSAGRPYFVMELVEGIPLTRYCDEHRLSLRQRLELFVGVCQAVQHAHHKGVIHRDLKPGNVLVASYDRRPVPKVIDFGVAKATATHLREWTSCTEIGTLVGTLEYMSPEQAQFERPDVDTRSDIYSLGVLLYELVTGSTPQERRRLKEVALLEGLRMIRDEEPPRPSTRLGVTGDLATVAGNRGLQPRALIKQVRGELDWIVMKALDKERNRRYESANSLATDLERYMNDEPVQACPPSARNRLGKFLRRNRRAVLTAAVLLLAVSTVAGTFGWAAWKAAQRQTAAEQGVDDALVEVQRLHGEGKWSQAQVALRKAETWASTAPVGDERADQVRQWRRDLELMPRLAVVREQAIETTMFSYPSVAGQAFREALVSYGLDVEKGDLNEVVGRIRQSAIRDHLIAALEDWVWVSILWNRPDLKRLVEVLGRADPNPWRDRVLRAFMRRDSKVLEALARDERIDLPPAKAVLLARLLDQLGQPGLRDLAEKVCQRVYRRHPGDAQLNLVLAQLGTRGPRQQEALGYWRAFLALRPHSADAYASFAAVLLQMGRRAEAEATVVEAIRLDGRSYRAHSVLGSIRMQQGRLPQAEDCFRTALRGQYPVLCMGNYNLAVALLRQDKIDEAEASYKEAVKHYYSHASYHEFGVLLYSRGRPAQAVPYLRKAVELKPDSAEAHCNLGHALQNSGQLVAARNAFRIGHLLGSRRPDWSYPSAKWFRDAERLVYMDCKLHAVLRGEAEPRDTADRLALAELCAGKRLYVASVRLFTEAFATEPAAAHKLHSHRYNAACFAVLAASSQDGDSARLAEADRVGLRRQALSWLRDELDGYRELLDREPAKERSTVAGRMQHWLADADFKSVRGEKALAGLSETERRDWQRLWADVMALYRGTNGAAQTRTREHGREG
jgi:serine/threonine protein kinase/tetratricopeptide (TPR) repeat protein